MKYQDIVVVKRWVPILKEYERTKAKVTPRRFKFVKDLCEAHHIHSILGYRTPAHGQSEYERTKEKHYTKRCLINGVQYI